MRFPRQRIRFARLYEGHTTPEGFLFLDLKGLDIEGVNTLVLDMQDVEAARGEGDRQEDVKKRLKDLFSE